jgi:SRSO17 transposase
MRMPEETASLSELTQFMDHFRTCFGRRDRARWAELYVRGLLLPGGLKNVEGLARQAALLVRKPEGVVAQALQNLVSHSPWDEGILWRNYRGLLASWFAHPDGVLVIDDLFIPKQGRHSVGVQRQYCTALGRKINCQVAVAIYYVGSGVCFPLAMRLYMPARWLRTESRMDLVGVPGEFRQHRSRAQIALQLLDELRGEQPVCRYAVIGSGHGADNELRRALTRRGFHVLAAVPPDFVVLHGTSSQSTRQSRAVEPLQPVTVERLVARVGVGIHSRKAENAPPFVRMRAWSNDPELDELDVVLTKQLGGTQQYAVGSLGDMDPSQVLQIWDCRMRVDREQSRLKDELGLDHFEGRSWRGFHHHACLVALAHGFRLGEGTRTREQIAEMNADTYCI